MTSQSNKLLRQRTSPARCGTSDGFHFIFLLFFIKALKTESSLESLLYVRGCINQQLVKLNNDKTSLPKSELGLKKGHFVFTINIYSCLLCME